MQVEGILIDLEKNAGFGRFERGMARFRLDEGTDSHTSDVGHWFGMTPLRGVRADKGGRPCGGVQGVRCVNVSPSGASRHLPRRGRLDATALPWHRGDAPQGYLFRFAPLRGHRPLRNVYRGVPRSGHIFFLMAEMAPFSRRDTWAWEMPISVETSIWVLPWQKRRARMLRWRSSRRAMASLRAM